jgi:hypothetical protein
VRGAQQRVRQRVQDDIAIGMAGQSLMLLGELNAAEP